MLYKPERENGAVPGQSAGGTFPGTALHVARPWWCQLLLVVWTPLQILSLPLLL